MKYWSDLIIKKIYYYIWKHNISIINKQYRETIIIFTYADQTETFFFIKLDQYLVDKFKKSIGFTKTFALIFIVLLLELGNTIYPRIIDTHQDYLIQMDIFDYNCIIID